MKKNRFGKVALAGLTTGILFSNQLNAVTHSTADTENTSEDGNMGYHLMTEDELLLQLNPEGTKMYKALTPDWKAIALSAASAGCNGTNFCAGLGACATDEHSCAGKNSCKAKGKCSFSDKNLAVKLVYEKMHSKRAAITPK